VAAGLPTVVALALPAAAVLPAGSTGTALGDVRHVLGDVVDSLAGLEPSAHAEEPARNSRDQAALEAVAATTVLTSRSDGSAGWSPLTASNADAIAARRRFAVPSPVAPAGPSGPQSPTAPQADVEPPVGFRPFGRGPTVAEIELDPMRSCPSLNDNRQSLAMRVASQAGGVTATFWYRATPGVQAVRLAAEPLSLEAGAQADVVWVRQEAPQGCQEVSVAMTGLATATRYRVVVVEEGTSAVTGRTTLRQVGRSEPVAAG
jgi:hypothetical protein